MLIVLLCVCFVPVLHNIFHTPMARYSLLVLKSAVKHQPTKLYDGHSRARFSEIIVMN